MLLEYGVKIHIIILKGWGYCSLCLIFQCTFKYVYELKAYKLFLPN